MPKVIKVPQGETYVRAENPKGEMGYYLVSNGNQGPYRLKIRSASFSNISILPWILEGVLVPDIIAIMAIAVVVAVLAMLMLMLHAWAPGVMTFVLAVACLPAVAAQLSARG